MKQQKNAGFVTSKKERFAYCLFFLGQNILWGYAGYVETFLTDVGIAAGTAAMILLVPKLWDAINDMLFGYLIDHTRFKNGQKFIVKSFQKCFFPSAGSKDLCNRQIKDNIFYFHPAQFFADGNRFFRKSMNGLFC